MAPHAYVHPSKDLLLSALGSLSSPLGGLVREFPGSAGIATDGSWLDRWFSAECGRDISVTDEGDAAALPPEMAEELTKRLTASGTIVARRLTLKSVHPQHFRGFRALDQALDLAGRLVVIEGRNSAGKTSLAEALEWLFTGQLQRRLDQEQGNPKELVDCVQSQVRPRGEPTFVEAVFARENSDTVTVRRTLVSDYGEASTSRCVSEVHIDGVPATEAEAETFFSEHFASVPPLLMQHTLRRFVHSGPTQRRDYFERLLSMNEITALIEKAVIGDARLKEFPSPTGSRQLGRWASLCSSVLSARAKKLLRSSGVSSNAAALQEALLAYARERFAGVIAPDGDYSQARDAVAAAQKRDREAQFPLLKQLTPTRTVDLAAQNALRASRIGPAFDSLRQRAAELGAARRAVEALSSVERTLAPAIESLVAAGLLTPESRSQDCPLCESPGSLVAARVAYVLNVNPIVESHARAAAGHSEAAETLRQHVRSLSQLIDSLLPRQPNPREWQAAIAAAPESIAEPAILAQRGLERAVDSVNLLRSALAVVSQWSATMALDPLEDPPEAVEGALRTIADAGEVAIVGAQGYAAELQTLVAAVSASARDAAAYSERQTWLELTNDSPELLQDLQWEAKKRNAQAVLEELRSKLMLVRQVALELRRREFSEEMRAVWDALRRDRYSQFKDLHIPPPSGRGYPVAIQVRATLDDGTVSKEVDALRIFSESQVHVLGLAAFLTRSKMLGHSFIVLDDPVQSMDEEHFKTFAEDLTSALLDAGLQLVVLTHNDTFARDLSWAHADRDDYVSIALAHSRRKGCFVSDDNRRVQGRLRSAERRAEEGDFKGAWYLVRVAVERLYTLVKRRADSAFVPDTWRAMSAEDMWNRGVGEIVETAVPGSGKELKRILDDSAAGAHDKSPRGLADVVESCQYVRRLIGPLRVGG